MNVDPGAHFLHEHYRKLHTSTEVQMIIGYLTMHGAVISERPADKITAYLRFLQYTVQDGLATPDPESIRLQVERGVVAAEHIPKRSIARKLLEQHAQPIYDQPTLEKNRAAVIDHIQNDQRTSLGAWANHLSSTKYPYWFKKYTFDSVRRMGAVDPETGRHHTRTKNTIAPFPPVNSDALRYTYNLLDASRIKKQPFASGTRNPKEEAVFQEMLRGGSFARIYEYAVRRMSREITETERAQTQGKWRTYPKGSPVDKLCNDLLEFPLNWCSATDWNEAARQLQSGDMHVYYTYDDAGVACIPRIAIRTKDGCVQEVRGIEQSQELEPPFTGIVSTKLQTMPGRERYLRMAKDRQQLADLEYILQTNPNAPLGKNELTFLYELHRDYQAFGFDRNSTLQRLRQKRGDQDRKVLRALMPEVMRAQFDNAYAAYEQLVTHITPPGSHVSKIQSEALFAAQSRRWRWRGAYKYAVDRMIADCCTFNLVMTPNIPVTTDQLTQTLKSLGQRLGAHTDVDTRLLVAGGYTPAQLSGVNGRRPVRFSLIPSTASERTTIAAQTDYRNHLQESHKRLNIYTPSILEAIAHWYTLTEAGNQILAYNDTQERAATLHLGMPPVEGLPDSPAVPITDTYNDLDGAHIFISGAQINEYYTNLRLAIG